MQHFFNKAYKNINNLSPIIFLCGVEYPKSKKSDIYKSDKRNILRLHLYSKGCRSVILEDCFDFRERKDILSYTEIGMENLNDIELLAALNSDTIIIIHESYSTAGEIALFASLSTIAIKTIVLNVDKNIIEEDKYGSFLEFAFNNNKKPILSKPITFYPVVKNIAYSFSKIQKHTYFCNNKIGKNLSEKIMNFIRMNVKNNLYMVIKKTKYGRISDCYAITYDIKDEGKILEVTVNGSFLKYYIISLFSIKQFRTELRQADTTKKAIYKIINKFKEIIRNSIFENESYDMESSIKIKYNEIKFGNTEINLDKAISFVIYSLHAANYITLAFNNKAIKISNHFAEEYNKLENLIERKEYKSIEEHLS